MIKSQDILVLLKLVTVGTEKWSYQDLSYQLEMSASQLHSAVKRLLTARLVTNTEGKARPNIRNVEEFLVYAVKYLFPAEKGEILRGIPTAHSAPPLNSLFTASRDEPLLVWPDPEGEVRGTCLVPIHKYAPLAAKKDEKLYELLVLLDAIRAGRTREQATAREMLLERLKKYDQDAFKY